MLLVEEWKQCSKMHFLLLPLVTKLFLSGYTILCVVKYKTNISIHFLVIADETVTIMKLQLLFLLLKYVTSKIYIHNTKKTGLVGRYS